MSTSLATLTVMGGNGFTADYIYDLRETLRRHYKNPRLPVGFLLGAAGDVTQVDNLRPGREFGEGWSSMFGLALGAEVIQTVGRLTWKKDARVQAVQTFIPIPIRQPREMPIEKPSRGLGSGRSSTRSMPTNVKRWRKNEPDARSFRARCKRFGSATLASSPTAPSFSASSAWISRRPVPAGSDVGRQPG